MAFWAKAPMSITRLSMKKSKATEALRVASEIAAIRAALKKRGYRIHKQPKQAIWKVLTPLSPSLVRGETKARNSPRTKASPNSPPLARGAGGVREETREFYLLTYQPAPISAWVLHPQNDDANRQAKDATTSRFAIATIIQRALKKQPANPTSKAS